jgi:hypothetical protein
MSVFAVRCFIAKYHYFCDISLITLMGLNSNDPLWPFDRITAHCEIGVKPAENTKICAFNYTRKTRPIVIELLCPSDQPNGVIPPGITEIFHVPMCFVRIEGGSVMIGREEVCIEDTEGGGFIQTLNGTETIEGL